VQSILTGKDVVHVFPNRCWKVSCVSKCNTCNRHITVSPLIGLLHRQVQLLTEVGIFVFEAYSESFYLYGSMSESKLVYTTPEQARPGSELAKYVRGHSLIVEKFVGKAHLVNLWDEFRWGTVSFDTFAFSTLQRR
jgi:hypothetical protein